MSQRDILSALNSINQKLDSLKGKAEKLNTKETPQGPQKSEPGEQPITRKWKITLKIAQAIGFVWLFISWMSQNIQQAKWEEKHNRYLHLQMGMVGVENSIQNYEIAHTLTRLLGGPNYDWKLYNSDINSIPLMADHTLAYASLFCQRVNEYRSQINNMKNLNERLFTNSMFDDEQKLLNEENDTVIAWFRRSDFMKLDLKMQSYQQMLGAGEIKKSAEEAIQYSATIRKKLNEANKSYTFWYIIGSIILATAFVGDFFMTFYAGKFNKANG